MRLPAGDVGMSLGWLGTGVLTELALTLTAFIY